MDKFHGGDVNWLPSDTVLGELSLEETLVFYDGPRVFSARSLTDQLYLVAWADEGPAADGWLYAAISSARLAMIRSGGLPLRAAFERPEGAVYLVTVPHAVEAEDVAVLVLPRDVPEEWLPGSDFRLDLLTHTMPLAASDSEIETRARQEGRTRLRLKVVLPKYTRSEAPTRKVGELLLLTQNVYDNIGLAMLEDEPAQRGRIPVEVAEQTQSDVVGLSAASFVIELAANKTDDLFGDSAFSRITERLLTLLDTELEREPFIQGLHALRPRGAKSFRNFVDGLASTGGDVTITGASSVLPALRRSLSNERLETLRSILHLLVPDEAAEIRGRMRLFKADMDRKLFGLHDELLDKRYEGPVAERAISQVDHAQMNDVFDVLISAYGSYSEAVGENKPTYVLERLSVPSSDPLGEPTTFTPLTEGPDWKP
jgi:hypothetical protein